MSSRKCQCLNRKRNQAKNAPCGLPIGQKTALETMQAWLGSPRSGKLAGMRIEARRRSRLISALNRSKLWGPSGTEVRTVVRGMVCRRLALDPSGQRISFPPAARPRGLLGCLSVGATSIAPTSARNSRRWRTASRFRFVSSSVHRFDPWNYTQACACLINSTARAA
jgi:hypothetical protein